MNPDSSTAALSQGTGKSRRRFRNFLFKPKHQINYGYHIVGIGVVFFGVTVLLIQRKMTHVAALLNQDPGATVAYGELTELFAQLTGTAMFGFFAYVLFCCVYALLIAHRVAGSTTAIIDFIEQLQRGNYVHNRKLRTHDELKPIHGALRRLAATLRDKDA